MSTAISRTSPTKSSRRTRADIDRLEAALYEIVEEHQPATVRNVFYLMVSAGHVDKTEGEYKGTVCRLLARMRKAGQLPYYWIADNTRWMRKPESHGSLADMLRNQQNFYRRDLWQNQPHYVEIWCEKDAISGVLFGVTEKWDVPLMVTRGYPSLTFLHQAGEAIREQDKPTYLYYFGDHDPSGVHIPQKVEAELRKFAPEQELHFERVAVLPEQIIELGLPTRPTKKSDSRSKGFEGESVEVDAIPPAILRGMVAECIARHVDPDRLERMQIVESAERDTLARIADEYEHGGFAP